MASATQDQQQAFGNRVSWDSASGTLRSERTTDSLSSGSYISDLEKNQSQPAAAASSSSSSSSSPASSSPAHPSPSLLSRFNPKNWSRKMRICAISGLVLAIAGITTGIAVPLAMENRQARDAGTTTTTAGATLVKSPTTRLLANDTPLRMMALGASITYGLLSSDGNGYREDLLSLLQEGGNTGLSYVGSRNNGTMAQNAVEGWPGLRIDEVLPKAASAVPASKPNVILLNVGTNDCVQDYNMDATTKNSSASPELTADAAFTVGDRMRLFVEDLFTWSPDATVVMSTLILNTDSAVNARVDDANAKFRAVADDLQGQGRRVVLADMSAAAGGPNSTTMADGTHPNDVGYALMADRFYDALGQASDKGFIVKPQ